MFTREHFEKKDSKKMLDIDWGSLLTCCINCVGGMLGGNYTGTKK